MDPDTLVSIHWDTIKDSLKYLFQDRLECFGINGGKFQMKNGQQNDSVQKYTKLFCIFQNFDAKDKEKNKFAEKNQ